MKRDKSRVNGDGKDAALNQDAWCYVGICEICSDRTVEGEPVFESFWKYNYLALMTGTQLLIILMSTMVQHRKRALLHMNN
ncbi:unnamed protein product [Euphydryas editha]|uniref:Uncharacterized protein n=1 Tax=Euphydryas editha TaxID=104508 RepID=A0AAU9TDD8_EUPED|nr:unnamed protein product [Euphydryas editha]